MTGLEIALLFSLVICFGLLLLQGQAAYRNGVTDGYGYSVEPSCPGYRKAGDYLKKHMAHRWRELQEDKS